MIRGLHQGDRMELWR